MYVGPNGKTEEELLSVILLVKKEPRRQGEERAALARGTRVRRAEDKRPSL